MAQNNQIDDTAQQPLLSSNGEPTYGSADASHRTEGSTSPQASEGTFKRNLGAIEAFAIVISIVIGSGVFTSPGSIDANVPSPGAALLIWLVGGVLAWTGASTLAELGTAIPGEGSHILIRNLKGLLLIDIYRRRTTISSTHLRQRLRILGSVDVDCCRNACYPRHFEHCVHRDDFLCDGRHKQCWQDRA